MSTGGFIDLRVGQGARGIGDDSVWPSFTDIMTVIVMIFLMALVIMMVRNFELDRQLVTTETSRDQVSDVNRGLLGKIAALEGRMQGLQGERDSLQSQLLDELRRIESALADNVNLESQLAAIIAERRQLQEDKRQLAEQSDANEAELSRRMSGLIAQFDDLAVQPVDEIGGESARDLSVKEQLDAVAKRLQSVKELLQTEQAQRHELGLRVAEQDRELAAKGELLAQLQEAQSLSTQQYAEARARIDSLSESITRRQRENAALQKLAQTSGERLRSLQEEYDSLDAQYRKLARPARSAAGKQVVTVWIIADAGEQRFRVQDGEGNIVEYGEEGLHKTLTELKSKHGKNLYTKIIIPENSPLTHNEAWQVTREILVKYDYYYQE